MQLRSTQQGCGWRRATCGRTLLMWPAYVPRSMTTASPPYLRHGQSSPHKCVDCLITRTVQCPPCPQWQDPVCLTALTALALLPTTHLILDFPKTKVKFSLALFDCRRVHEKKHLDLDIRKVQVLESAQSPSPSRLVGSGLKLIKHT